MTRYGYARVSTREQNPDHQIDALLAAGVDKANLFIEKVSGKLSSRSQLDSLLAALEGGDQVVITRLRRLGRSHQHLLDMVRGFNDKGVDFIVLEQGIDTTTPGGRLVFHVFAALAEYDRELIVEGTLDGLAAARARGRVGGRPPALSQRQLDQAQTMYDAGKYTVAEIAQTLGVGRSTLYRTLHAHNDGADCALIVYRSTRTKKIDPDTLRRYGETGAGERAQLEADRKWFPIAPTRWTRLKAVIYVVDGVVARIRAIDPDLTKWDTDDRGYADIPVTKPLAQNQVAQQLPTLNIALGDTKARTRGKIREYITL